MEHKNRFLIHFLGVSIFIVAPFAFSPSLQDIESSPRYLLQGLIVAAGSLLVLINVISNKTRLPVSRFMILFFAWLIILSLSLFKSISFYDAFLDYSRWLMLFYLFILFSVSLDNQPGNTFLYARYATCGAIILMAFGALQIIELWLDARQRGIDLRIDYAIGSTVGNKNFFAETLLLLLPLAGWLIFNPKKIWSVIATAVVATIILFIVLLKSLSTWIAVAGSIGIVLPLIWFRVKQTVNISKPQWIKPLIIAGALAVISCVIFLIQKENSPVREKLQSWNQTMLITEGEPDSLRQNSVYERLVLWKNSLEVFKDFPITGAGTGNWKLISPKYGIGEATYMAMGSIRFVHPHNEFLLVLAETGIAGLLVLSSIISLLLYYSIKKLQLNRGLNDLLQNSMWVIFMISLVIILMFSMPLSKFFAPVLLALCASIIVSDSSSPKKHLSKIYSSLVMLIIFCSAIFFMNTGWERLKSDFLLSDALLAERNQNFSLMKSRLQEVNEKYYPMDVTATPIQWYRGYAEFYLGNPNKAKKYFQDAEKVNPYHLYVLNDLGTCYSLEGKNELAKQYYQSALSLQDDFPNSLENLAIIYYNEGKTDSAYHTLLKHHTKISQRSLPVFRTIIQAHHINLDTDSVQLSDLNKQLQHTESAYRLLRDLRRQN
jgi:O-antigen ligase